MVKSWVIKKKKEKKVRHWIIIQQYKHLFCAEKSDPHLLHWVVGLQLLLVKADVHHEFNLSQCHSDLLELIIDEGALHLCLLGLQLSQLLQPPLAHALPLQLLLDHFGVLGVRVGDLPGFDLLFLLVDGGHCDGAELAHVFGPLGHHDADLLGSLWLFLAVDARVAETLSELDHGSVHDEGGRIVFLLVLVKEQQSALAALFAVLPLDAIGSLDVRVLVHLDVAELVGMFSRVNHTGSIPGPHGQLLELTVQYQHHLSTQAVVDVERLLPVVVLLSVSGIRAHDASRHNLRHYVSQLKC